MTAKHLHCRLTTRRANYVVPSFVRLILTQGQGSAEGKRQKSVMRSSANLENVNISLESEVRSRIAESKVRLCKNLI